MTEVNCVLCWDEISGETNAYRETVGGEPIKLDRHAHPRELVASLNKNVFVIEEEDTDEPGWTVSGYTTIDDVTFITLRSERNHLATIQIVW